MGQYRVAVNDWWPFNGTPTNKTDWGDSARIAVPAAALIAAVVGAVIATHGQRTRIEELETTRHIAGKTEENRLAQLEATRDANVTDRYTKAVET